MDEGGRAQTVPEGLSEQQQQQLGRQNVVLNYGGIPHPAFERWVRLREFVFLSSKQRSSYIYEFAMYWARLNFHSQVRT